MYYKEKHRNCDAFLFAVGAFICRIPVGNKGKVITIFCVLGFFYIPPFLVDKNMHIGVQFIYKHIKEMI